jgi:general secretion pathway protein D
MKMIKKIIRELDVVLAQVLIEAVYLDVSLDNSKSLGISFSQNPSTRGSLTGAGGYVTSAANSFPGSSTTSTTSSGTNGSSGNIVGMGNSILNTLPQGLSYFGAYGQDFNAIIEAAASDSHVTVLSRPQIQTSHAVEAELFIGSTIPYVTGTQNYGYSSGPSATYTQMEVGIRLRILPLINPDGLVEMDIDQEIEQINGSQEIAGVGQVPTTSKDDAGAKVSVYSGQTIILGGYINARRETDRDGVPYLMDIPVLGNLFKSSSHKNSREELILLIRPTVLKTPEIAAQVATEERATMGGITQAEREIRQDEDARNAQANKELAADAAKQAKKDKKAGIQPTNSPAQFNPNDIDTGVEFHVFGTNNAIDFHLTPTNQPVDVHPGDTNQSIRPTSNDTNTTSIITNQKP